MSTPTSAGGAVVFVPASGEYVMLNEVSALVVGALGPGLGHDAVVDLVLSEYDATRETVSSDVRSLLGDLLRRGAVEEVPL